MKAPTIDVYNAPAYSTGAAGHEDSTIDTHNNNAYSTNEHIYENVTNCNVVPTQMLCDSIAHKNHFMKTQLKFLLDHLSEAYE